MNTSSELYSSSTSKPMGEAVGNNSRKSNTSREMESLSLEIRKYPRDLLQLATNQSSSSSSPASRRRGEPQIGLGRDDGDGDDDEDDDSGGGGINLGLGLSLGGKFGVDKSHKVLKRSSSIIGTMPFIMELDEMGSLHTTTLARTASLPLETEDEWRKRKEIQTSRRMEAKRRRSEKQKSLKGSSDEKNNKFGKNPFGSLSTSSSSSTIVEMKGRRTTFGSLQGFLTAQDQQRCPQESEVGGGASSTASELDSRAHQGSGNWGESISPASIQSSSLQRGSNGAMGSFPCKVEKTERCSGPQVERSLKKREADMPSVFTIGDGRKVEGILYKYGKGEEARIMCVCHGSFFSPAEFVKHAGGTNVDHPLRHIVVSPSPSALR